MNSPVDTVSPPDRPDVDEKSSRQDVFGTTPFLPRPVRRPRRLRQSPAIRELVSETLLTPQKLILPQFVIEGEKATDPIASMPGRARQSIDLTIKECEAAFKLGVKCFALFPVIDPSLKTPDAREALNPKNLVCRTLRAIKKALPGACLITDIAL
ncbi:MAG: porphobilinogen synthase, partial [Planctomycetes bacterium]|nr:porphobilinogen synthase [Planctomycetota bacterium]